jgi:hypothetical protein
MPMKVRESQSGQDPQSRGEGAPPFDSKKDNPGARALALNKIRTENSAVLSL